MATNTYPYESGYTVYCLIRSDDGNVLNITLERLESWSGVTHEAGDYAIDAADQGGDLYMMTIPIFLDADTYTFQYYIKSGDDPSTTDIYIGSNRVTWNGSLVTESEEALIPDAVTYATMLEADTYFAVRLNTSAWSDASGTQRSQALTMSTLAIDRLNFVSEVAVEGQVRQFPRLGADIPQAILDAVCENALALLDDMDVDHQREESRVGFQSMSGVKVAYIKDIAAEHIIAGIMSSVAWDLLKPYLRARNTINVKRRS